MLRQIKNTKIKRFDWGLFWAKKKKDTRIIKIDSQLYDLIKLNGIHTNDMYSSGRRFQIYFESPQNGGEMNVKRGKSGEELKSVTLF